MDACEYICMMKPVISIEDHQPMIAAISVMEEHEIDHLLVTADESVIGILSVRTLSVITRILSHFYSNLTDERSVE